MHEPGVLHKRIMRWGDEYCVLLSGDELDDATIREGDEVDVRLTRCDREVDWEALPHESRHRRPPLWPQR